LRQSGLPVYTHRALVSFQEIFQKQQNLVKCGMVFYQINPISPRRLIGVLNLAIRPVPDASNAEEVKTAYIMSLRFLAAVLPVDIPQLKEVFKELGASVTDSMALTKLFDIYGTAAQGNPHLPSLAELAGGPPPRFKARGSPPPPSFRSRGGPSAKSSKPGPAGPRPREACRACDGQGYRKKVDKENVMKETTVTCSRCGGSRVEPSGPGFQNPPKSLR